MRTILILSGILVPLMAGSACTARRAGSGDDGRVRVTAAFYPLAEAAQRVGGDLVDVTNLTAPGVEPHDLELTSDQLASIETAKVVLYLGGGFQPAVEDAIRDATGETVDVSAAIRSLPMPPGESANGLLADPHVWLDPMLYEQIVRETEAALDRVDPRGSSTFKRGADAFVSELSDLDAEYRRELSGCQRTLIVTSHAAFGYLARRYGLRQEPIAGLSPDVEPDPRRLAQLKDLVEADGVTTIFTEALLSPKIAETLAQETGATTAVLDPLESLTPDEVAAGADYGSIMRRNLQTLGGALGCA
jgi:zinc transport system substrate-binding protein